MRAVVQRVREASVIVDNKIVASISSGLCVLIGIHSEDTTDDSEFIIRKLVNLRIFDDQNGVMNRSVKDIDGDVLLISQFTLYGETRKGNRPSYGSAMVPDKAEIFYNSFIEQFKLTHKNMNTGVFWCSYEGSVMQ